MPISFRQLLQRNYFNTPTVLLERKKLGGHRFSENQKYSEDYRLWLELTHKYRGLYLNNTVAKSITGKFNYGFSGLSSNLWQMEKGELSNFYFLWNMKKINGSQFILCSILSLAKFFRRKLILAVKHYGM